MSNEWIFKLRRGDTVALYTKLGFILTTKIAEISDHACRRQVLTTHRDQMWFDDNGQQITDFKWNQDGWSIKPVDTPEVLSILARRDLIDQVEAIIWNDLSSDQLTRILDIAEESKSKGKEVEEKMPAKVTTKATKKTAAAVKKSASGAKKTAKAPKKSGAR